MNDKPSFLEKMLIMIVFVIYVFDVPCLIKPVFRVFRKYITKKYGANKKIMEELKKLEKEKKND